MKLRRLVLPVLIVAAGASLFFNRRSSPTQQEILAKKLVLFKQSDLTKQFLQTNQPKPASTPNLLGTKSSPDKAAPKAAASLASPVQSTAQSPPNLIPNTQVLLPRVAAFSTVAIAPTVSKAATRGANRTMNLSQASEWALTHKCLVQASETILIGLTGPDADRKWKMIIDRCGIKGTWLKRVIPFPRSANRYSVTKDIGRRFGRVILTSLSLTNCKLAR